MDRHLRKKTFALGLAATCMIGSSNVSAEHQQGSDDEEYYDDRVRADLPIYTMTYDELWPRRLAPNDEGTIGCESRVTFGDWKFEPFDEQAAETYWLRLRNFGVFTCAALLNIADEQDQLSDAEEKIAFFVQIGEENVEDPTRELWALQQGTIPGSDYLLLSREINEELVSKFTVLQRKCPIGALRSVLGMDSWLVSYCAINSHEDLLRFANEMLKLPPLGTLEMQEGPDASAPDSSNSQSSD
jgi:hypothetical protein